MFATLLFLSLLVACYALQPQPAQLPMNHAYQDGKVLRLPLDGNATEELLDKWMNQAISGLMAAVASGRLDQLDSDQRDELQRCSKAAYTVPEHAVCVVKVLNITRHIKRRMKPKGTKNVKRQAKATKNGTKRSSQKNARSLAILTSHVKREPITRKRQWVGGLRLARAKRSVQVVNRSSYNLTSSEDSFLSKVVRQTTQTIRKLKDKDGGLQSWRATVDRIKYVGEKARAMAKRRKVMKKRLRQLLGNTPSDFEDTMKRLAVNEMEVEDEKLSLKRKLAKEKNSEIRVPMRVFRESLKIALALSGKNVSDFDKKTIKLLSPRFLSIVPEQDTEDLITLLSPSLFSIHDQGNGTEKSMSLPNLIKALPNKDQEAWLDFIMEASGVIDAVDMTEKAQKHIRERETRGPDGTPLYFVKENVTTILGDIERRKIETFEELDRLYTEKQKDDLDKQGYAFLTTKQLDVVYGPASPYNKSDSHQLFKSLLRMHDDPHHLIENNIRALAEAKKFRRRQGIELMPFVLMPLTFAGAALSAPVVLSPLVLSPITLSPAVLGPIILSPWVFTPLTLSPRVLAPLILNPLVFSPILLSPLVLHPLILVPGVFNPVTLSPMVLSPLILSPQVFTPVTLSPLVLSPLIYNPMAGSPLVLSPFLLSPIICSPQFLFAVVLSPYALSPIIQSKLIASEVILSPSWMS
ncbi:hypothetical protein GCK32_000648 [Trichostrongylus colubriformis]|uniref:Uncharacterized protein n=1 Tax=Trichostrongylus colubriformis TaxID=6319 RepID=A0AAN8IMS0_TRICO